MKRVSFEGNVCSGKTLYLKLLDTNGYHVSWNHMANPTDPRVDLYFYENSPYSIKNVYGMEVEPNWIPDIIIYLYCHPVVCYERSKNRGGSLVEMKHLQGIHLKYEILCDEINCPVTLYKINSHEDIESVYKNICDVINSVK